MADLRRFLTKFDRKTITKMMAGARARLPKLDRKSMGKSLGLGIIIGAALLCLAAMWVYINRPQTDDATVRANFIGVAPHASGHIVQLLVKDNQFVHEGDLLFAIDPRPYEHAVARAKANLVLARKEVAALEKKLKVADASIIRAEAQVSASAAEIQRAEAYSLAAEASVQRAEGEFKDADDHLNRLAPLLAKELTTADVVESARTRRLVAETAVREAQKGLSAAQAAVAAARAQHLAVEAALDQAKVERLRAEDAIGREGNFNARIGAAEAATRGGGIGSRVLQGSRAVQRQGGGFQYLAGGVRPFRRAGFHARGHTERGMWWLISARLSSSISRRDRRRKSICSSKAEKGSGAKSLDRAGR